MAIYTEISLFTNVPLNIAVACIASAHNISLLLYHCYTLLSLVKKGQSLQSPHILSIFCMIMITIFSFSVLCLYFLDIFYDELISCNARVMIGLIAYLASKYGLYILLLERLFIIFAKSEFKFSQNVVYVIRVLIALLSVICFVCIIIFKVSNIDETGICLTDVPIFLQGTFVLIDLSISMFVLVLFSRKLWLLASNTKQAAAAYETSQTSQVSIARTRTLPASKNAQIEHSNKWLLTVLTKVNVLGIIAVCSTQVSLVLSGTLRGNLWTVIDSMVNMWCVLLIFLIYNKIFEWLCKPAMNLVSDQCLTMFACRCCGCCIPKHLRQNIDEDMISIDVGKNDELPVENDTELPRNATTFTTQITALEPVRVASISVDDEIEINIDNQ